MTMKIAIISSYPKKGEKHSSIGGLPAYAKSLAECMALKDTIDVFVLCNKNSNLKEVYVENKVTVIRTFDKRLTFFWDIAKVIRTIKPDVVHLQQEFGLFGKTYLNLLIPLLIILSYPSKFVTTLHGVFSLKNINNEMLRENYINIPKFLFKVLIYFFILIISKLSKEVIVHEKYFKNILIEEYDIVKSKIHVVPLGIDNISSINRITARKRLKLPLNQFTIFFMGFYTGRKGIGLLIEQFGKLIKKSDKFYLVIGTGLHPSHKNSTLYLKEYEILKMEAARKLGRNCKWIQFIPDKEIPNYFSASDLCVFPYTTFIAASGPMGIALAYEKAILASTVFSSVLPKELIFSLENDGLCNKVCEIFNKLDDYKKLSQKLKKERLWKNVIELTIKTYVI